MNDYPVGVDGCKAGWIAVAKQNNQWEVSLFPTILGLWSTHKQASLILIDIPIGLPNKQQTVRKCDQEARKILAPKRSASIFSAPSREAVYASNYAEANEKNRQVTGKGLSKQSWNISPKIREVDELLMREEEAIGKLKEAHPEVCFAKWANEPMQYNKKQKEGLEERMQLLRSFDLTIESVIEQTLSTYKRSQVALDDIVDAFVLAVTASLGKEKLQSIPENQQIDEKGIPMEITYSEWYFFK